MHKTKNNKFFRLWRYKIKIKLHNVCTFDIRRTADRMSKIRHPKKGALDVECSTSEEGRFGCRIFDIRRTANRMSKIRHPKKGDSNVELRPIESKKSDPTNKANRIEFSTFDPTECTRLVTKLSYFMIIH